MVSKFHQSHYLPGIPLATAIRGSMRIQEVGLWQPLPAACLQGVPCLLAGKTCDNYNNVDNGEGAGALTVAHSILAEDSLGISHTKLTRPPSKYSGTSCHADVSLPVT